MTWSTKAAELHFRLVAARCEILRAQDKRTEPLCILDIQDVPANDHEAQRILDRFIGWTEEHGARHSIFFVV